MVQEMEVRSQASTREILSVLPFSNASTLMDFFVYVSGGIPLAGALSDIVSKPTVPIINPVAAGGRPCMALRSLSTCVTSGNLNITDFNLYTFWILT